MNKSGGVNETFKQDPVLDYRVWSNETEADEKTPLRPLQMRQINEEEAVLSSESMLATIGFLLALVLVGFIGGYSLRGNAYAAVNTSATSVMPLTDLTPPVGLDDDSNRSKLIAVLGSNAPDELLAFNTANDGNMTALVRLHDTSEASADSVSLLTIDENGSVHELTRFDALEMRASDVTSLSDGRLVTATLRAGVVNIESLDREGGNRWGHGYDVPAEHLAEVKVVAFPAGTATVGPSKQLDQVRLTFLGLDGELIWQRSFVTNSDAPDFWLKTGANGSVLLAVRSPDTSTTASHILMRIDGQGREIWSVPVDISTGGALSGLVATSEGGAYLLTTGPVSSLTRYDAKGAPAWDVLMPQAQHFSDIHLLATAQDEAVIATSYALGNERLDIWIEQRNQYGQQIGEINFSLPGLSSIGAVSEASPGRYLLAGSIMPEQFEDSDVFIKSFEFEPVLRPAERVVVSLVPEPAYERLARVEEEVLSRTPEIELAETDTSGSFTEAVEVTETTRNTPVVLAVVEPAPALSDTADVTAISSFIANDGTVTNVSIEGEQVLTVQCRFSCLEAGNSTTAFPMWRAITALKGDFSLGLSAQHELTCQAAGGRMNPVSKPDCGGF